MDIKHIPNNIFGISEDIVQQAFDNAYRTLKALNVSLYENQLRIFNEVIDWSTQYLAVVAARGSGKCITGDSLIFTDTGIKKISDFGKDIPSGDIVENKSNVFSKDGLVKTSFFYNDGIQKTFKIRTNYGFELEGTEEHPILILDKECNVMFRKLKDIERGDFVCIQRGQDIWSNTNPKIDFQFSKNKTCKAKKFNLPLEMSIPLAKFCAYIISEGHICTKEGFIVFCNADEVLVKDFQKSVNDCFGIQYKQKKTPIEYVFYSTEMCNFLKYMGIEGLSKDKTIPDIIMQSPKEVVRAFIRVLFDAEGCVNVGKKSIELMSASEQLIKRLQMLLLNFGIISKNSIKYCCAANGAGIYRPYWRLNISTNSVVRFYEQIGFLGIDKQNKLKQIAESNHMEVRDVVPYAIDCLNKIRNRFKQDEHYKNSHIGGISKIFGRWAYYSNKSCAQNVTYAKLEKITNKLDGYYDVNNFKEILKHHFFFDKIVDKTPGVNQVYDFVVPEYHNFTSNGFISHNTFGVSAGLILLCNDNPNLQVGVFAPKWDQANRVVAEMTIIAKKSNIKDTIDWKNSTKSRLQFKNGSIVLCQSASEATEGEGYHFNCIILDESQAVSDHTVTNRILPMAGSFKQNKIIKIGVPKYRNHFYRSFTSPMYKKLVFDWTNSPILLQSGSIKIKNERGVEKEYSKYCLSGDTKIPLLNGTIKTIKELSETKDLNNIYTYSLDGNNNIVSGKVSKAWKSGTKQTYKITLDNYESFKCTYDHPIMVRDGSFVEAGCLHVGQSIMPLYRKEKVLYKYKGLHDRSYEQVYNPGMNNWEYTHRQIKGKKYGKLIHHKNFNKHDNSPENLEHMNPTETCRESMKFKIQNFIKDYPLDKLLDLRKSAKNWRQVAKENGMEFGFLCRVLKMFNSGTTRILNHKIVSIELDIVEDVYDLTIDKYHNFALDCGVFVHNCLDRMPLNLKMKQFPNNPEVHYDGDMTEIDFRTQYMVEWVESLNLLLSEEDQIKLSSGTHELLNAGKMGEEYFFGIDFASGTILPNKTNLDSSVLSIWRKTNDNVKEKVYGREWQGNPLDVMKEMMEVIDPKEGLFKCRFGLIDYSVVGVTATEYFKREHVPCEGIIFGSTNKDTKKNYKNSMYDQAVFEIKSERAMYPHAELESNVVLKKGYNEWCNIERQESLGINAKIEAPSGEHDDFPSADVLAIWAADKTGTFKTAQYSGMKWPTMQFGVSTTGVGNGIGASSGIGTSFADRIKRGR